MDYQITIDRKSGAVTEEGDIGGLVDAMVKYTAAKMGIKLCDDKIEDKKKGA